MKNLPNILTLSRIFLAVLLLVVLLHWEALVPSYVHISWRDYCAFLIFCIASITDFFDGYIARQFDLTSAFGEIFDPLADKMLMLGAFIGLLWLGRADTWAVFIILSREFYITGLRVAVASSKHTVAASALGKLKTIFQIVAVAFLLVNFFPGGEILLWIATALTVYSGLDYTIKYYRALA